MTDRERNGPDGDELRLATTQLATAHGAMIVLALLACFGLRRLCDADQLTVPQRFQLLDELQLMHELLS